MATIYVYFASGAIERERDSKERERKAGVVGRYGVPV
jgi:hypothetical protein